MKILQKLKVYGILDFEIIKGKIELTNPQDNRIFLELDSDEVLQLSQELKGIVNADGNSSP